LYKATRTDADGSLTSFGETETLRKEAPKEERLIKRPGGFKMNYVGNKAIEVKLDRTEKKRARKKT